MKPCPDSVLCPKYKVPDTYILLNKVTVIPVPEIQTLLKELLPIMPEQLTLITEFGLKSENTTVEPDIFIVPDVYLIVRPLPPSTTRPDTVIVPEVLNSRLKKKPWFDVDIEGIERVPVPFITILTVPDGFTLPTNVILPPI